MKTSKYDAYWNAPENWKWHLFYYCKEDLRVIVPKKPTWAGRTLNFAHSRSYIVLVITILLVAFPILLSPKIGFEIAIALLALILASLVIFYYNNDLEIKN